MKKNKCSKNYAELFFLGIKLLWQVSHKYFVCILLLSILGGIISPFNAIVWRFVIDSVSSLIFKKQWANSILIYLIIFSLLKLFEFMTSEISRNTKQTFSDYAELFFTNAILKYTSELNMEHFDNPDIYDQLHIALNESSDSCMSLLDIVSGSVQSIIQFVSFAIIVINLNWVLVPLCIISSVPILLMNFKIQSCWYDIFTKREETQRLCEYLKTLLIKNENIKEVKLYNITTRVIRFLNSTFLKFIKTDKKTRKRNTNCMFSIETINELISILTKAIIVYFGIYNQSSIGMITLYFSAHENLKTACVSIVDQLSGLQNCIMYLQSFDRLTNIDKASAAVILSPACFNENFHHIEFKGVTFKYPRTEKYVLKNFSFMFENHKSYSIVGMNGSGKTTLIKLLLRLYIPNEGEILIDGVNINSIDINEYYSHISAVFQDFLKLPYSIIDNISIRDAVPDRELFDEAVDIVGIKDIFKLLPEQEHTHLMKEWNNGVDISQGQWQKIAIARCCYGNCAISILDEPFSSIDAKAEAEIISKLSKQRKDKLTIFVTHQFTSISLADQIVVIENGVLIESGTHDELIKNNSLYSELYNVQLNRLKKQNIEKEDTYERKC